MNPVKSPRQKKVLLATPLYPPEIGGPATYTKELSARLEGHAITILAYADNAETQPKTELHTVSKRQPLLVRLIRFFFAALTLVKKNDVIYVQNAMAAGLPVMLACALRGRPYIVKFVGDEAWERARQHRATEERLEEFLTKPAGSLRIRVMMRIQGVVLRRAAFVVTPSAYLADEIEKHYGVQRERLVVNYNAAEEGNFSPFTASPQAHQIAATARLVAWKGVDGIIRATAKLIPSFPDIRLVIAGDGPEEDRLKELARNLHAEDHVTFLGQVSRAETWHLRKNSGVYVLNSTYEGLPHTALTSFAARIPLIATNIPGTNEAVIHEKTGLLVKPSDDDALAAAIQRIFTDAPLRERLVRGAAAFLEEKFSWGAHLALLEKLFQTVCAKPRDKA